MRGNVRFHYNNSRFFPTHLSFDSENELTMFLLKWQPKPEAELNRQAFGRALRTLSDLDVSSLYPNMINIKKEN